MEDLGANIDKGNKMKSGWTVGQKLIAAFALVGAVTLALGFVGYYGAMKGAAAVEDLGTVMLPKVAHLLTAKADTMKYKAAQRTLLDQSLDPAARSRQYETMNKCQAAYKEALASYEKLPQETEAAALWQQLGPSWEQWEKENTEAVEKCKSLDKTGITDSTLLGQQLDLFRGDHYRGEVKVLALLQTKQTFEGGDDPTACNCGKWLKTFTTTNPTLSQATKDIVLQHNRFHQSVGKIKELVKQGNAQAATDTYTGEMAPAAEAVFAQFQIMRGEAAKAEELAKATKQQIMVSCRDAELKAMELLDKLVDQGSKASDEDVGQAVSTAGFLKWLSIGATIAGVAAAIALGLLITRSITRALKRIIEGLNSGSEQTAAAAGQVSSASQSLAEGASEQAAAIEETSSSIEEMSSMTKQNAGNAGQAKNLAATTRDSAAKGVEAMTKMSRAIDDIKKSADKTAKIIKTIDEIAFQTNLLALNAAVEAARAGDAGKGFAVVAEEVRNLAQRSAEAAKNTANMIEESVKNAENGVAISQEVGKSLTEIANVAHKVNDLVAEIAAASNEQSQGIEQVNTAVTQMDKVTQSNAANAEESASASEELSAQAEQLRGMVGELVAMVGGAKAAAGNAAAHTTALHHKAAPKASAAARKKELTHMAAYGGNGHGKAQPEPEDVIPMNSDKELARF
jgi:methyl-accepting chemotaxis protein